MDGWVAGEDESVAEESSIDPKFMLDPERQSQNKRKQRRWSAAAAQPPAIDRSSLQKCCTPRRGPTKDDASTVENSAAGGLPSSPELTTSLRRCPPCCNPSPSLEGGIKRVRLTCLGSRHGDSAGCTPSDHDALSDGPSASQQARLAGVSSLSVLCLSVLGRCCIRDGLGRGGARVGRGRGRVRGRWRGGSLGRGTFGPGRFGGNGRRSRCGCFAHWRVEKRLAVAGERSERRGAGRGGLRVMRGRARYSKVPGQRRKGEDEGGRGGPACKRPTRVRPQRRGEQRSRTRARWRVVETSRG